MIQIRNILNDKTPQFLKAFEREAANSMGVVGTKAVKRARGSAPVDKGDYRKSIQRKVNRRDLKSSGKVVLTVGASDWKSNWIENGTIKLAGKHIIQNATVDMLKDLEEDLMSKLEKLRGIK